MAGQQVLNLLPPLDVGLLRLLVFRIPYHPFDMPQETRVHALAARPVEREMRGVEDQAKFAILARADAQDRLQVANFLRDRRRAQLLAQLITYLSLPPYASSSETSQPGRTAPV